MQDFLALKSWPRSQRLMAVQAARRNYALRKLDNFEDLAVTDSVDQGREFVPDPEDTGKRSKAHYRLDAFQKRREHWLKQAYPEEFTPEKVQARKAAEQDAKWAAMRRKMGVINA